MEGMVSQMLKELTAIYSTRYAAIQHKKAQNERPECVCLEQQQRKLLLGHLYSTARQRQPPLAMPRPLLPLLLPVLLVLPPRQLP